MCRALVAAVASLAVVMVAYAQKGNIQPPDPDCQPFGTVQLQGQMYPTLGLEPERPIWCYAQPQAGPPTAHVSANEWDDVFDNNGPAVQSFADHAYGYRVFDTINARAELFKTGYFVNTDHWMIDLVDLSPYALSGGVLVSPDQQFFFEDGKLVVEVDAAAGADAMGGANRFYEIDLSPAPEPTGYSVDNLYGYGAFGGVGALGCRLERNDQGGNFVCAMYDNSNRVTGGECPPDGRVCTDNGGRPGRVWETQGVGTARAAASIQGGYPEWPIPGTNLHLGDVWRQCRDNEHDLHCRDRFRMEVTQDSIHLFVNGFQAMQIDGLFAVNPDTGADNRVPDFWFEQGARPYFTSWVNGGQHAPIRWHWDRIAVNPHDASGGLATPSAAPSFCLGSTAPAPNTCPHEHIPGQPEVGPTLAGTPTAT
jgi:hypothetical protein